MNLYNQTAASIKPENIKAIAIDLDGTVLQSDSQLSGRTISVFKMLEKKGVRVIITTGRSVLALKK
ncbi:hypothetical protein FACS189494_10990 [Spirochaetia bacterium]|nr:hypothetical protein FACS189494_10990 [Spirochaetia bacterium]